MSYRILENMKKLWNFWKVIILDTLGIVFMVLALLTGWLPGPGGIPLFIIGLSLLAINHDWAQRYIDILKNYADKIGDVIFVKNHRIQILYDTVSPLLVVSGVILLVRHSALWMITLGIFFVGIGLTFMLGNRGRWKKLKRIIKQSS